MENSPVKRKCEGWDVEAILSCFVCSELLLPPVLQCANAHIFCVSCFGKFANGKCPTCRVSLQVKVNNRLMDKVLGCYYVNCKFKGCKRMISLASAGRHYSECSFNDEIKCPVFWGDTHLRGDLCRDVVSFSGLDEHLLVVHKLNPERCSNPVTMKYCNSIPQFNENHQMLQESKYFVIDKKPFLCAVFQTQGHVLIKVVPLEIQEKAIIKLKMKFNEHRCKMEKNTFGLRSIFNHADFLISPSACDLYSTQNLLKFSVDLL